MSNKLIDIDADFSPIAKEKIQDYLKEKYGTECFAHIGTFSALGPASAAKDLLRIKGVDFKRSNEFTASLKKELSWEENINNLDEKQKKFYLEYEYILKDVPNFINKIRNVGSHASGIVITDKPIYNYVPVERVNNSIVTAFGESGQNTELDSVGLIKLDILGITILDVLKNAIDLIKEKIYLIEEDGIKKIVPESYLEGV